jgi:hypothetical protein
MEKATTGKRFTEAAKQRILQYINKQGRGGITKAVEKYGVTYPSIKRWISGIGIENPVKMREGILNGQQKNLQRKPVDWTKRKLVRVGQTWRVKPARGFKVISVVITGKTFDDKIKSTVYMGNPIDENGVKGAPVTFTNEKIKSRV